MKTRFQKIVKRVAMVMLVAAYVAVAAAAPKAYAAAYRFAVSPMNQKLVLNPGDSYDGTFIVANPGTSETDIRYNVVLEDFYVDDDYNTIHEEYGNTGEILDWITITSPTTGVLSPNESTHVNFTIDVPYDAAGGGQYASFTVTAGAVSDGEDVEGEGTNAMIKEVMSIAHLIFVEIAGDNIRQGEIVSVNVPSFLLSGNIAGNASIKNTGNTYGTADYTLQVFPLFSDEELFTNEEEENKERTILPDRTLYNETVWDKTPVMGIFNVVYTVEFEGVTAQVSKMVIKCPIWMLFIIILVIAVLIIWLLMWARGRKGSKRG